MTWGSGLVQRRLRYPGMRRAIRHNLEFLSDADAQRMTLDYDTSMDPWSWDQLNDAIEDTFITGGRPTASDTIGIVLYDDRELEAMCAVSDAIDHVLENERDTFDDFERAVTAPSWPSVISAARDALEVLDSNDHPPAPPSREVVRSILDGVARGSIDAGDAHHWSNQWTDDILRSGDPILADAMWHVWLSGGSGGPNTVDPTVVSMWIDDLDLERPDLALLATNAISRAWLRDELHAYSCTVDPRASSDAASIAIKLIYWHTAGLAPLPEAGRPQEQVTASVVERLIEYGMSASDAQRLEIRFDDEAPRWPRRNR